MKNIRMSNKIIRISKKIFDHTLRPWYVRLFSGTVCVINFENPVGDLHTAYAKPSAMRNKKLKKHIKQSMSTLFGHSSRVTEKLKNVNFFDMPPRAIN